MSGAPTIHNGLALYRRGQGRPVFLMPHPHGDRTRPTALDPMADLLVSLDPYVEERDKFADVVKGFLS